MDGNSPSYDTAESDNHIDPFIGTHSRAIIVEVSEITPVSDVIIRQSVIDFVTRRVGEMAPGGGAVGKAEISVSVDVEAVLGVCESFDGGGNLGVAREEVWLCAYGALGPDGGEVDGAGGGPAVGGLDVADEGGEVETAGLGDLGDVGG